jgi:ABC-type Fe3+ transport system substrate-binding protein
VRSLFSKRFPKIKLDLTVDFSKYHDSKLDRYLQAGKHYADILFLQDLHVYPRYKEQNNLLPYKPPTFYDLYNSHQDPDGAYLGISICEYASALCRSWLR